MNAPPPLPEKPPMPSPSWTRALGGVWRLTYWRALTPGSLGVLAGLLALFALLTVTNTRVGDQAAFQQWGVRFYLGFAVPVVAFLTTAGLVRDDMTPATVDYVFTRSLRRGTFVLLRFLCHAACLELQCLAALCVFWIIGLVRHVPDAGALVPVLAWALVMDVVAFGAMGLAFGVLTKRYLVAGLIYAGVVELGVGNIPTSVNALSMVHHVRSLAAASMLGEGVGTAVLALAAFSVGFTVLAATVFSLREMAGAAAREG